MKIVHGGGIPFTERNNPRGGTFHYKRLVEGAPGAPGNFGLMLSQTFDNFVSPRHRHNFEQIRYQLEGTSCFGRDGDMQPGTMGYFPEGAFYGPQSAIGPALVLVLQFGGPSGSGYMSEDELQASVRALSLVGEFRGGVFHRAEGSGGRARQDAYEAAWEHRHNRPLAYPEPQYPGPILVPGADAETQAADGVTIRSFGRFKGGTAASVVSLRPGAGHALPGNSVVFLLSGSGTVAGQAVAAQAAIHLAPGETAGLAATDDLDALVMELPQLAAVAVAA